MSKVTPVDTIIYTEEAEASRKKAEQEKGAPDPPLEIALAILQGETTSPAPSPGGEAANVSEANDEPKDN